jgi:hypothetical protein
MVNVPALEQSTGPSGAALAAKPVKDIAETKSDRTAKTAKPLLCLTLIPPFAVNA